MHGRIGLLLCTAALLLTATPRQSDAQVLLSLFLGDKVSSEKFHLGVNIGVNGSTLNGIDGTKLRSGFMFGVIGEWRFASNWYLQPELLPFYHLGANNLPPERFPPPEGAEDLVSGDDVSTRLNYLAIPVIVKVGLANRRLHLGAGPQVNFVTSARESFRGQTSAGADLTVDRDVSEEINSTDAGAAVHIEWKLRPGTFSPSLNLRGYLGLTDIIKDNPGDAVYNRAFSVFFTMAIGGSEAAEEEFGDD